MSRWRGLASAVVKRADKLIRVGVVFKPLAVYIPDSMVQDEGVDEMMQRPKITRTAVAMQKIEYEPRISEVVWAVAFIVAHAHDIWSKPVRLQVASTYILELYDRVLT